MQSIEMHVEIEGLIKRARTGDEAIGQRIRLDAEREPQPCSRPAEREIERMLWCLVLCVLGGSGRERELIYGVEGA